MVEDLLHVALLDHVAAVHDDHLVGDVRDHAHVVGDDEHGGVELVTGEAQQVENFGLHGHVEGSGRLVARIRPGFSTNAMAMTMRCFWPPENWCG